MPVLAADELSELLLGIYAKLDVPEEEAATVVRHQVDANLCGHDSHGALRTPIYGRLIEEGRIKPGAPFEVVTDNPASLVVDGHRGLGYVVTERAQDLLFEKARSVGVAALSVREQSHIGRLGAYTDRAADNGLASILMADSGRGPKSVAPYGGSDRRLGTNPLSIALPASLDGNVVLDMATSAVAGGKVKVARSKGVPLGRGWAVDSQGRPTLDPEEFYGGGSLLPMGGDQGHKGYGLSFVVESLAAVLSGIGFGADAEGFPNDGIFMVVLNVDMFRPLQGFRDEMAEFARYVKESPPAPGFDQVYYPGEIETLTREKRRAEGIELPPKVHEDLMAMAAR